MKDIPDRVDQGSFRLIRVVLNCPERSGIRGSSIKMKRQNTDVMNPRFFSGFFVWALYGGLLMNLCHHGILEQE